MAVAHLTWKVHVDAQKVGMQADTSFPLLDSSGPGLSQAA